MPFPNNSGFDEWKIHKHLTDIGTHISSATELDHFLRQNDCDTTTWGLDEHTSPVEVLYRAVRDNKCALLLRHNDPESAGTPDERGQLVRCVFSIRLRIVREDGDALVQVNSKEAVPIPWHSIQVIDEAPFHAAERILARVAGGMQPVCLMSNSAHEGPIPGVLNIDEKREQLYYTPQQFEAPADYSKHSTSFPTLETLYHVNVLTVRLHPKSLRLLMQTSLEQAQMFIWLDERVEVNIYERERMTFIEPTQNLFEMSQNDEYEDDEDPEAQAMRGSQTRSALLSLPYIGTLMHRHIVTTKKRPADRVLIRKNSTHNPNATKAKTKKLSTTNLVKDAVHRAQKRAVWPTSGASPRNAGATITSTQQKTAATTPASACEDSNPADPNSLAAQQWFIGLHENTAQPCVTPYSEEIEPFRCWLREHKLDVVRYSDEDLVTLLNEVLSMKSELKIDPINRTVMRALRVLKLTIFSPTIHSEDVDEEYGRHQLVRPPSHANLAKLNSGACTDRYDRQLTLEKLTVEFVSTGESSTKRKPSYIPRSSPTQNDRILNPIHAIQSGEKFSPVSKSQSTEKENEESIRDTAPYIKRPRSSNPNVGSCNSFHQASTTAGGDLNGGMVMDAGDAFSVDASFRICINVKVGCDEMMLDALERTIEQEFGGSFNPHIVELTMFTPLEESNESFTFPGLHTMYYLHHAHVRVSGLPTGEEEEQEVSNQEPGATGSVSFVTQSRDGLTIFNWKWMDRAVANELDEEEEIIRHYLKQNHTTRTLRKQIRALLEYETKKRGSTKVDLNMLIEKERSTILDMLKREVTKAAKGDKVETVQYIIRAMNKLDGGIVDENHNGIPDELEFPDKFERVNSVFNFQNLQQSSSRLVAPSPINTEQPTLQMTLKHRSTVLLPLKTALVYNAKRTASVLIAYFTQHHPVRTLEELNLILVAAALVNDYNALAAIKDMVAQVPDAESRNAASLCILPVLWRGHHESLEVLMRMAVNPTRSSLKNPFMEGRWTSVDMQQFCLGPDGIHLLSLGYKPIWTSVEHRRVEEAIASAQELFSPHRKITSGMHKVSWMFNRPNGGSGKSQTPNGSQVGATHTARTDRSYTDPTDRIESAPLSPVTRTGSGKLKRGGSERRVQNNYANEVDKIVFHKNQPLISDETLNLDFNHKAHTNTSLPVASDLTDKLTENSNRKDSTRSSQSNPGSPTVVENQQPTAAFAAFVRSYTSEEESSVFPSAQVSFTSAFLRFLGYDTEVGAFETSKASEVPIGAFGWTVLLQHVCEVDETKTMTPLSHRKTKCLKVILASCRPTHPLYRLYLGKLLISMVSACWDDARESGYELESKVQIVEFLEVSHYPVHTSLLSTSELFDLAKRTQYFRNEFSVLGQWMETQTQEMLDHCSTQQEADAMLFEQTTISDTSMPGRRQLIPACETSAMYLAINSRNESVVSSKWFQGTNKKPIWFYEWWRTDTYPVIYESTSNFGRAKITVFLFFELILLVPVWCFVPFSKSYTIWSKGQATNSAYFKFMEYTVLYCCFVIIVIWAATERTVDADKNVLPFTYVEVIMYWWSFALGISEAQAIIQDVRSYLRSVINRYDFTYVVLFLCSFASRCEGRYVVLTHPNETTIDYKYRLTTQSDTFMCFAAVVVVFRLTHLSGYHSRLGPLYESILKMSADFLLFFFILGIILLAAAVGFLFLLRRYADFPAEPASEWNTLGAVVGFLGSMLFKGEIPEDMVVADPLEQIIWYCLTVTYLTVVVIVLTNLLIAMMNKTYERTHDSALKVYLNGRMALISDYADLPMVPAPINLVTFPFEILGKIYSKIKYGDSGAISCASKVQVFEFEDENGSGTTESSNSTRSSQRRVFPAASVRSLQGGVQDVNKSPNTVGVLTQQWSRRNSDPLANLSSDVLMSHLAGQNRGKQLAVWNNSLRKVRTRVLKRYFRFIREELAMGAHVDEASELDHTDSLTLPDNIDERENNLESRRSSGEFSIRSGGSGGGEGGGGGFGSSMSGMTTPTSRSKMRASESGSSIQMTSDLGISGNGSLNSSTDSHLLNIVSGVNVSGERDLGGKFRIPPVSPANRAIQPTIDISTSPGRTNSPQRAPDWGAHSGVLAMTPSRSTSRNRIIIQAYSSNRPTHANGIVLPYTPHDVRVISQQRRSQQELIGNGPYSPNRVQRRRAQRARSPTALDQYLLSQKKKREFGG